MNYIEREKLDRLLCMYQDLERLIELGEGSEKMRSYIKEALDTVILASVNPYMAIKHVKVSLPEYSMPLDKWQEYEALGAAKIPF